MHFKGIADAGGAGAQHTVEATLQWVRTVEIHPRWAASGETEARQEAWQTEDMVAVHVGDEHPAQLRQAQITAQELMLGALTAVEQPHLRAAAAGAGPRLKRCGPGRHPRTRTEKSDSRPVLLKAHAAIWLNPRSGGTLGRLSIPSVRRAFVAVGLVLVAVMVPALASLARGLEPQMRVLLLEDTQLSLRSDGAQPLRVKGLPGGERRLQRLQLSLQDRRLRATVDGRSTQLAPSTLLTVQNDDPRGIWLGSRRYRGVLRISGQAAACGSSTAWESRPTSPVLWAAKCPTAGPWLPCRPRRWQRGPMP